MKNIFHENNIITTLTQKGIPESATVPLLNYLLRKRVIRFLQEEKRYELAHDVMVNKVWEWTTDDEKEALRVQDMLVRALPATLLLGIAALLIEFILGVFIAVTAARRPRA